MGESLKRLIGQRIARVRENRGLTQQQLAERLSTPEQSRSKQTISDWENGRQNVSVDRLVEIAGAVGVEEVSMLPVAGDGYRQGLRDARYMAETAYTDFRHRVGVAIERSMPDNEAPVSATDDPDGPNATRGAS